MALVAPRCVCSVVSDSLWPYGPPASSVHGISQARILEWLDSSSSRGSFWPRDGNSVSCMARRVVFNHWAFLVAQLVKNLSAMLETWVRSLDWEDPLEKEMAIHSSTLAWKIPWMEEPGRLHVIAESDTTKQLHWLQESETKWEGTLKTYIASQTHQSLQIWEDL